MFESSTSAYTRMSYTVDLSGLFAHALDTFTAYRRSAGHGRGADRLPRSRVGPIMHAHLESCAIRTAHVR